MIQLIREKTIETVCSYLVMSGILLPDNKEIANFLSAVNSYNNLELAELLVHSKLCFDNYLEHCWKLN